MSYVVDIRHVLDEDGSLAPGLPGKHARHYVSIVEAATASLLDDVFLSEVPCRFRPGRKSCPGTMIVCRRASGVIVWQCSGCSYEGILSGWEGSQWDLSSRVE